MAVYHWSTMSLMLSVCAIVILSRLVLSINPAEALNEVKSSHETNSLLALVKRNSYETHVNRDVQCRFNVVLRRFVGKKCHQSEENESSTEPTRPIPYDRHRRDVNKIQDSQGSINSTDATHASFDMTLVEELRRKVSSLESRLFHEAVANRELKNIVIRQSQKLETIGTSLQTHTNNFSKIETAVKDLKTTMKYQQEVYKSMDHKLSGVMLDVAEVNNMISTQRQLRSRTTPDKTIPVETASEVAACSIPINNTRLRDCADVYDAGHTETGVYYVTPLYAPCPVPVYCDMDTPPGGWLLIQRRYNGHVSFDHNWREYRAGFGDVTEEHWLGNDNLFLLTNQRHYELRVDLWDFYGSRVFAEYKHFKVDGERDKYRLHVANHTGTAPDGLGNHDGMYFSTPDQDNDAYPEYECAREWAAGWWFSNCWFVILNGQYYNHTDVEYRGISWNEWKAEQLNRVEMKIRPVQPL